MAHKTTLKIEDFDDLDQLADIPHTPGGFTSRGSFPNDPEKRNNCNVIWAAKALQAYVNVIGRDEIETSISDLLGDLMHLADAAGVDFDELLNKAEWAYGEELEGED
ncbi:hypothetical protein SEA_CHARM_76 [Mycobacterium phage Charm]|nr:hypothetical protein SEA_CHARM_76 [Mycobacterium phage Charm]QGJ88353.1 hypothetical protein SEA_DREAMTEAM1_76 [Mycobacterium phage DreamTeam1]